MLITVLAADLPNSVHLPGDVNKVYWASIAFFVVVGLAWWKGWPALGRVLDARTNNIRAEIERAEVERRDAEAALAERRAGLGDIGAERQRILAEAAEAAERVKADIVARARADADALRARASAELAAQRNQALGDLRAMVAELTHSAAEVVVRQNLDQQAHEELIDSYIDRVRQLA